MRSSIPEKPSDGSVIITKISFEPEPRSRDLKIETVWKNGGNRL
jgi:hypothetical protein